MIGLDVNGAGSMSRALQMELLAPMKISLCTVTYNEAHRISQFLDNAAPHVDEICIADQASTDGTVDAIMEWSYHHPDTPLAVVHDKHWGYCEPSRKKAHALSTGNFILVLDADERISDEFARVVRAVRSDHPSTRGKFGYRLKRSLWVGGFHYWTGDYQYRFFERNSVHYLDELHTEPQPTISEGQISAPEFVGIWHEKSWVEQIRDENAYSKLINSKDLRADAKLALNVYSGLLAGAGITAEEADLLSYEELEELGIAPIYEAPEQEK